MAAFNVVVFYFLGGCLPFFHTTDGHWVPHDPEFNKTYIVTSILSNPYLMLAEQRDDVPVIGNDRFTGFIPELLAELGTSTHTDYIIRLVADGKYGSKVGRDENGNQIWNGMIGEIMNGKADIAAAPLTISSMRMRVVDFTQPYMNVGITMLMKQSTAEYIHSVPDLLANQHVLFGTIDSGSTYTFFRTSMIDDYERIYWHFMPGSEDRRGILTINNEAGVDLVRDSPADMPYVFFIESSMARWYTTIYCNLTTSGFNLDSKGYGLAFPFDSDIYYRYNLALQELKEVGVLARLEAKWFWDNSDCQ